MKPSFALPIFLFSLSLAAPAIAATIAGRVVDPDGRAVAGARVVVAGAIGTVASRETDDTGAFAIDALAAGQYEVRVLADGFNADPIAVALGADDTRMLHMQLRVSAVSESILVSASQVDLPLSRAADSVTVITGADLRARQVETIADALRFVPGLAVA